MFYLDVCSNSFMSNQYKSVYAGEWCAQKRKVSQEIRHGPQPWWSWNTSTSTRRQASWCRQGCMFAFAWSLIIYINTLEIVFPRWRWCGFLRAPGASEPGGILWIFWRNGGGGVCNWGCRGAPQLFQDFFKSTKITKIYNIWYFAWQVDDPENSGGFSEEPFHTTVQILATSYVKSGETLPFNSNPRPLKLLAFLVHLHRRSGSWIKIVAATWQKAKVSHNSPTEKIQVEVAQEDFGSKVATLSVVLLLIFFNAYDWHCWFQY